MTTRNTAIALTAMVAAVLLQTTLFAQLKFFGAAPSLVVVVIVGSIRYLEPEPAILLGFTGGILMDLLGDSPLGLWALSVTVVAYVAMRLRRMVDDAPVLIWLGVFGLTLGAEVLFLLAGTLFGQKSLSQAGIVRTVLLSSTYTTLLAAPVIPLMTALMATKRRGWAL